MTHSTIIHRLLAVLTVGLALTACSSEEATPAESIGTSTSDTLESTSPTDVSSSATSPDSSGDSTGSTTGDEPTGDTLEPTTGGEECLGPNDCWMCTPTTNGQVINGCTDATCEGFANARRLPLLEPDGSLPPLP